MPRLEDTSNALSLLDPLLSVEPVAALKLRGLLINQAVTEIHVDDPESPRAVLLTAGRFHSFFAADVQGAHQVLDELDWSQPQAFSGLWEPLRELVDRRGAIVWENPCHQFHLPESDGVMEHLFELRGDDAHLMEPTHDHVGLILDHWPYGDPDDPADRDHVAARIDSGMTAGWVEDHKLVCWAMTHDDGSLGYLHTLDGYRGHGIARRVTADLVLKVWNRGQTPFCHVVADNDMPVGILDELSFSRHDDRFLWLGTEGGE